MSFITFFKSIYAAFYKMCKMPRKQKKAA